MRNGLHWMLFCQVIDNWGDIGVCWRLARHLLQCDAQLTLYVDDPSALAWMAATEERSNPALALRSWAQAEQDFAQPHLPCDVVIEAFACRLPAVVQRRLWREPWLWINLEYLSAEAWVERCHGLPSPQGPEAKLKWFFHPGLTARTGGLLRAPMPYANPKATRLEVLAGLWQDLGLTPEDVPRAQEKLVLLFAYAHAPLQQLSAALGATPALIVQAGTPSPPLFLNAQHRLVHLPLMTQNQFDTLIHCSDFNLVRGEDSWVQALWACAHGTPGVWHIYAQSDHAHHAKLRACLERLGADALQSHWHAWWNGLRSDIPSAWPAAFNVQSLLAQTDLCTQLRGFVRSKLNLE